MKIIFYSFILLFTFTLCKSQSINTINDDFDMTIYNIYDFDSTVLVFQGLSGDFYVPEGTLQKLYIMTDELELIDHKDILLDGFYDVNITWIDYRPEYEDFLVFLKGVEDNNNMNCLITASLSLDYSIISMIDTLQSSIGAIYAPYYVKESDKYAIHGIFYNDGINIENTTFSLNLDGTFQENKNHFPIYSSRIADGFRKSKYNDNYYFWQGNDLFVLNEDLDYLTQFTSLHDTLGHTPFSVIGCIIDEIAPSRFFLSCRYPKNGVSFHSTSVHQIPNGNETILEELSFSPIEQDSAAKNSHVIWYGMSKLSDNTYYTGGTYNLDHPALKNTAFNHIYLTRIDTNHVEQWRFEHGDDGKYILFGVRATSNDDCLLWGQVYNPDDSDLVSGFIMRVNKHGQLVNTTIIPTNQVALEVFPNPTSGQVTLSMDNSFKGTEINVYNNAGQLIRRVDRVENDQVSLELSEISTGVYHIVIIKNNQMIASQKLVKK